MLVPNTRLFAAGDILTGAMLNQTVTSVSNFILGKPIASLYNTTPTSIATGGALVLWTTETVDRDNGHSTTTNTDRYTAATPGWYRVNATIYFAASTAGSIRQANIYKNGAVVTGGTGGVRYTAAAVPNGAIIVNSPTVLVYLNGTTDYVQVYANQDSGAGLNIHNATAGATSSFVIEWVSL